MAHALKYIKDTHSSQFLAILILKIELTNKRVRNPIRYKVNYFFSLLISYFISMVTDWRGRFVNACGFGGLLRHHSKLV